MGCGGLCGGDSGVCELGGCSTVGSEGVPWNARGFGFGARGLAPVGSGSTFAKPAGVLPPFERNFARATTAPRSAGVLPGGLTASDWATMTAAERETYLRRYAATENDRNTLIAEAARQGITTISDAIRSFAAQETARQQREADIRIATINANRDIEIARIHAANPGLSDAEVQRQANLAIQTQTTNPATTTTTTATIPTWVKWTGGIVGGLIVVGGVVMYTMPKQSSGRRANPWTQPPTRFAYQDCCR